MKSITVQVVGKKYVSKYSRFVHTRKKFMAHDELEEAKLGDIVRIVPCLPKSRKKRHRLMDIVIRGKRLDDLIAENKSKIAAEKLSRVK
jgi:small subunit ribosomal protein S17